MASSEPLLDVVIPEEDVPEEREKVNMFGLWSNILFVFGCIMYFIAGAFRLLPGFVEASELNFLLVCAEFVGALVFFLSPPLDFCDACERAYAKEDLLIGLSPKNSIRPTCKARWLSCCPWGTMAAVCFLLGGLVYMISAVVDGFTILCELDYIHNMTETCIVVEDDNVTSGKVYKTESWPEHLNDYMNTAGGWIFTASAVLGAIDYWINDMMDQESVTHRICCSTRNKQGAVYVYMHNWKNIDWLFWGVVLFVIVGVSEILNADPFPYSDWHNVINSIIWIADSMAFTLDWFSWQEHCCECNRAPDRKSVV